MLLNVDLQTEQGLTLFRAHSILWLFIYFEFGAGRQKSIIAGLLYEGSTELTVLDVLTAVW